MQRLLQNVVLFLLCAPAAFAADVPDCPGAEALRGTVKTCNDNLVYAQAGKLCLDRYDAAIAAAQASVAASLKTVANADQQSQSMENAKKGYALAIASLKELVNRGEALKKQVQGYKSEVVMPDDFASATEAGMSAENFLQGQGCYIDTQKLVDSYSDLLGLHAKQLSLTAQISERLAKRAFKGETSLKNQDLLPLLKPKAGKSVAVPSGKAKQGQSDITGIEEDRRKSQKK